MFDDEEPATYQTCPCCGGYADILGQLGQVEWMRCQNCGGEFHQAIPQAS